MELKDASPFKDFYLTATQFRKLEYFLPKNISISLPSKLSSRQSTQARKVAPISVSVTVPHPPPPISSVYVPPPIPPQPTISSYVPPPPPTQIAIQSSIQPQITTPNTTVSIQPPQASAPSSGTKVRPREIISMINKLKKFDKIKPFLEPVDPVLLNIPDYFLIITRPMDISTIETKARDGQYETFEQFEADVKLIVANAVRYNPPDNIVHTMAVELGQFFDQQIKLREQMSDPVKLQKLQQVDSRLKKIENKKTKIASDETPLTYNEKIALVDIIKNKLPQECMWDILCIVAPGKTDVEEIDFDLDKLPTKISKELQAYVLGQIRQRSKKKKEESFKEDVKEPSMALTASNVPQSSEKPQLHRRHSSSSNWATSGDEF